MKKTLLTSILAITFAIPAFATIESGSTCDTTNLGQSENNSTANVEADWTANTISIDWYSDTGDAIPYASTTCTYDGTITLPAEPTKTGYTFAGWRRVLPCADYSNQSACHNASGACVWDDENNTCNGFSDFCFGGLTQSDCSNRDTIIHNTHPELNMINCVWSANKCTILSLLG